MNGDSEYETNLLRAAKSVFAGAIVGTIPIAIIALYNTMLYSPKEALRYKLMWELGFYIPIVFVCWLIGLVFFAGPVWAVLHLTHRRGWWWALTFGLLLPFPVVISCESNFFGLFSSGLSSFGDSGGTTAVNGVLTPHGWANAIEDAGLFSLDGGIVAAVIWKLAYKRFAGQKPLE